MKAVLRQGDGFTTRVDLPDNMHERNERIKELLESRRLLWKHTDLAGEDAMEFFGTANDSKLYTGQSGEGWETDITASMIRAVQAQDTGIAL